MTKASMQLIIIVLPILIWTSSGKDSREDSEDAVKQRKSRREAKDTQHNKRAKARQRRPSSIVIIRRRRHPKSRGEEADLTHFCGILGEGGRPDILVWNYGGRELA